MIFPRVSVVIAGYNDREYLEALFNSLNKLDYPKKLVDLVFVDNGSNDGSSEFIKENFPNVRIIRNQKNLGFSGGYNAGIKSCSSEYIAILNTDTKVEKDWLKELVKTMEENQDAACCGAREQPYDSFEKRENRTIEGNWIGGGSVLFRKKALDDVGLFDESFFAYWEDVDLSFRLKSRKWRILLNQKAVWHHAGMRKTKKITERIIFLGTRNWIYILIKFGSPKQIIKSIFFMMKKSSKQKSRKTNEQEKEEKLNKPLKKSYLYAKILKDIIIRFPVLLRQRSKIKRDRKISQEEIDKLIRNVEKQLAA